MITIEHENTGMVYTIPDELCDIDLFYTHGCFIVLPTGEEEIFCSAINATEVLGLIEDVLRKGWHHLYVQEWVGGITHIIS